MPHAAMTATSRPSSTEPDAAGSNALNSESNKGLAGNTDATSSVPCGNSDVVMRTPEMKSSGRTIAFAMGATATRLDELQVDLFEIRAVHYVVNGMSFIVFILLVAGVVSL